MEEHGWSVLGYLVLSLPVLHTKNEGNLERISPQSADEDEVQPRKAVDARGQGNLCRESLPEGLQGSGSL